MEDHLKKNPNLVLPSQAKLKDAMEVLTRTQIGIALVVSEDKKLLGIVVDSDIRRTLLRGESMETPITQVMNQHPFVADASLPREKIMGLFRQHKKAYIPLVDRENRLVGLASMIDYLTVPNQYSNRVVIMAGGQGTRLRPLTENCPKPMVPVGHKPILEHNLEYLATAGFSQFIFCINYLGSQIQQHFQDGSKWGVTVDYVSEPMEMGTAGALSLIEQGIEDSFIVMNGDLLTKVNFRSLLEFHQNDGNLATVCVREYDFQVPYGVIQLEDNRLAGIVEKPVHRFFVNAGIYVLEPQVLQWLPKKTRCDMPHLLQQILRQAPKGIGCFPIQEYWMDVGRVEDYQRALQEYSQ